MIGLTLPEWPLWVAPERRAGWTVKPALKAIEQTIRKLRQRSPHIVVMAMHRGLRNGPAFDLATLLKRFPEIDVVLGGHSGSSIHGLRRQGALYAQCGGSGELGRIDLVYDTVRQQIRSFRAERVRVSSPASGERLRAASSDRDWIGEAMAACADADAALWLQERPVSGEDPEALWRALPHAGELLCLSLTAGELEQALSDTPALRVSGLVVRQGSHGVDVLKPDGTAWHPRRRIRVALPEGLRASAGGQCRVLARLADRSVSRLEWLGLDTRLAVWEYHRQGPAVGRARSGHE